MASAAAPEFKAAFYKERRAAPLNSEVFLAKSGIAPVTRLRTMLFFLVKRHKLNRRKLSSASFALLSVTLHKVCPSWRAAPLNARVLLSESEIATQMGLHFRFSLVSVATEPGEQIHRSSSAETGRQRSKHVPA